MFSLLFYVLNRLNCRSILRFFYSFTRNTIPLLQNAIVESKRNEKQIMKHLAKKNIMQSINSRLNLFLLSLSCIRFLIFFFVKYECEYNELARGFITSEYLSNSPNSMFTYSLASYFTLIINRFNCSRMRFVVDSVFTLRFCTRIFHQLAHSHEKMCVCFFLSLI